MLVIFKSENGQTEEFENVKNFDKLVELAEDRKDMGVCIYSDDAHDDTEIMDMTFDLQNYADAHGWDDN